MSYCVSPIFRKRKRRATKQAVTSTRGASRHTCFFPQHAEDSESCSADCGWTIKRNRSRRWHAPTAFGRSRSHALPYAKTRPALPENFGLALEARCSLIFQRRRYNSRAENQIPRTELSNPNRAPLSLSIEFELSLELSHALTLSSSLLFWNSAKIM